MEMEGSQCDKCKKFLKTKKTFKRHSERKSSCKVPTYFCSMCKRGMSSYRTLWEHKKKCKKQPESSVETEEKIKLLRKKVNLFLNRLNGDFSDKLEELDRLFAEEDGNEKDCIENDK